MSNAITVAVVGHTNAGKTSLMRTLLRDSEFGEVSDESGTTRHVEGSAILLNGEPAIELYDTPGLEDSIGLLGCLESLNEGETGLRTQDGHALMTEFISRQDEFPEFAQEAKVIRQLLADDLIFYVMDSREPVLGKYKDELQLLSYAAKPVIPVLNFIASERARIEEWKTLLSQLNFHAQVDFDTVVFRFEDEKRLLTKMQTLLSDQHQMFEDIILERTQHWNEKRQQAAELIAGLMIDCAGYYRYSSLEKSDIGESITELQQRLRQAEKKCLRGLLTLFSFDRNDIRLSSLPVSEGEWEADLFDPSQLKKFTVDMGSDMARGAAIGASVDLMVGGISLGAATVLGAIGGALWSTGKRFGRDINAAVNGEEKICADDATLQVLWQRQLLLLSSLQSRGHAATTTTVIKLNDEAATEDADTNSEATVETGADQTTQTAPEKRTPTDAKELPKEWKDWIKRMRANSEWSQLNPLSGSANAPDRKDMQKTVAKGLLQHLE